MSPQRIIDADALTLARCIRNGEVGAVEAFDAVAAQVEAGNPTLNALLRFDAEARPHRGATGRAPAA